MKRHLLSPKVARAVAASAVGCALLVVSARAHAQDPSGANLALGQGFGAQGQIAITGELNTAFSKVNKAGWGFNVQPSADYFVMPSVSVGGLLGFAMGSGDFKSEIVGLRAGYNINVMEHIGAWAKVGAAYQHASSGTGTTAASSSTTYLTADLPLMYHIVPHLFFGIGPYYYLKVAGDGESGYGFHSLVGGWF
jgi:hypothetical protein